MKNGNTKIKLITCLLLLLITAGMGCKKEKAPTASENTVRPGDFLGDASYDQLIVEIQCISGFEPNSITLDNLKAFLIQRLNKPGGITFLQNSFPATGKSSYSIEDVRAFEKAHRTQQTNGKILTAYFFFADADYASNSGSGKVLGMAYGPSSMVIYEKTIKEFSGGLGQPSSMKLETTVLEHEFCHILGLVNNGTVLQSKHQDEPNGKHCTEKSCLMYYTVETSDFVSNLLGGNIPLLDSHCIDDLRGNGGK